MPFPLHTLVSWGGSLTEQSGQDEIWQNSVRIRNADNSGPVADPIAYMNEIHQPLRDWWTDGGNKMSGFAFLAWLKVNNITQEGRYVVQTTNEYLYSPPVAGGAPYSGAPSFCSIAYSWRAATLRGPSSHGRIFPPNYTDGTNGGSAITSGSVNGHRGAAVALIHLLQNTSGTQTATPCIVSRKFGIAAPIVRVGIGNVYDYQSRRKNAVPETYSFVNV